MKQKFLTLIAAILISISSFAQSYIGKSKEYILNSISEYTVEYSYKDNVLTAVFSDYTALYAIDDDNYCMFYLILYEPGSDLSALIAQMDKYATRVTGYYKWYTTIDEFYIFYKITSSPEGTLIFSAYPSFYEDNVNSIIIEI